MTPSKTGLFSPFPNTCLYAILDHPTAPLRPPKGPVLAQKGPFGGPGNWSRLPLATTKSGWLSLRALRKKDDFCWVLYKSRSIFVEMSMKAGWLLFRALLKPFKKRVIPDNTKFREKIAYVGGPPFRWRPSPFGERRSRVCATSATLV